ncbi:hypothetical protein MAR_004075 [Mya arenaria]|uniref:Uncharacterized protein n=1 Tax=Mya arenaria TaxID=6604 RepID=A0ABY7EVI7_MYAAR|nr:hypothetical protein MAR_004075 [Mya arenaria]
MASSCVYPPYPDPLTDAQKFVMLSTSWDEAHCCSFPSRFSGGKLRKAQDWCNISKIVERHSKSQCHIDQLIAAEKYLTVLKGQKKDIVCTISSQFNALVEENRQILVTVVTTLDRLADEGHTKVAVLKLSVTNFEFIVTLVAIEHLLSALVPLSNILEAKDCDLLYASNNTRVVMVLLQAERNDDEVWNSLFEKVVDIACDVDVIPSAPRHYGRQQNRPNAPRQHV